MAVPRASTSRRDPAGLPVPGIGTGGRYRGPWLAGAVWILASTLFLLSLAPEARCAPEFPALTGRVVDRADILSADDVRAMTIDLEALEQKTTDQFVVVTLNSLQGYAIEDFGYQLGRAWAIGQAGKNNGVLLIVAPNERKVRIEVGYGLEGTLTDALTKTIIENAILPRFRAGDFPGGIKAGVRDVIAVLTGDAGAIELRSERRDQTQDMIIVLLFFLIWFAMFGSFVWGLWHSAGTGKGRGTWHSGSSGGGWSSGGGGGGGFSGGGGSFGGGGSSGSW